MATYIGTNENGKLIYEIEPEEEQTLFPNEKTANTVDGKLTDFINGFNNAIEVPAVSGLNGYCMYIKIGRMVVCSGTINVTGAAGDTILTGLPKPITSNALIPVVNGNVATQSFIGVYLGNNGDIKIAQAVNSASLRFMFSYVSAE